MLGKNKRSKNSSPRIFDRAKPNRSDVKFLAMTLVMTVIFFVGYLQATNLQNFGTIYLDLAIITFLFILTAVATNFNVMAWVVYGTTQNNTKLFLDILIGLLMIGAIFMVNNTISFSIAIPLSITSISSQSNALTTYSIVAIYGPIIEELFWIGVIFTSLRLYHSTSNPELWTATFLIIGLLLLFLGLEYFGAVGMIIGGFLIGMASLSSLKKIYTPLAKIHQNNFIVDMLTAIFFILVLHVYSYGNPIAHLDVFLSAGAFFLLEGLIDYYRGSIVPSIIMHSVNNAVIGAAVLGIAPIMLMGISIPAYVIMIAITISLVVAMFRVRYGGGEKEHNKVIPYAYMVKGGAY